MNFEEILEYTLIQTERSKFTVLNLLIILGILVLTRLIAYVLGRLLRRRLQNRFQGEGRRFAVIAITRYAIYIFGILLILANSGFDITVILAGSTALLVGLGFGLQNMFKDLVSGVILLFEGSIEVNDVVEVGPDVGKVKHIGLRTSKILTLDGIMIIVPNSKFVEERVVNLTNQQEISRFHVKVTAAYGSNPREVEKALLEAAAGHSLVEELPKSTVRFSDYGDSGLIFELLFWTRNNFAMEDIKSSLRFRIFDEFRKAGIRIPYPQRDIHIKQIPGNAEDLLMK